MIRNMKVVLRVCRVHMITVFDFVKLSSNAQKRLARQVPRKRSKP